MDVNSMELEVLKRNWKALEKDPTEMRRIQPNHQSKKLYLFYQTTSRGMTKGKINTSS